MKIFFFKKKRKKLFLNMSVFKNKFMTHLENSNAVHKPFRTLSLFIIRVCR